MALVPWPTDSTESMEGGVQVAGELGLVGPEGRKRGELLGGIAALLIQQYAPGAPDQLKDYCLYIVAGYLNQKRTFHVSNISAGDFSISFNPINYSGVLSRSGVASLLNPWRVRRAGIVQAGIEFAPEPEPAPEPVAPAPEPEPEPEPELDRFMALTVSPGLPREAQITAGYRFSGNLWRTTNSGSVSVYIWIVLPFEYGTDRGIYIPTGRNIRHQFTDTGESVTVEGNDYWAYRSKNSRQVPDGLWAIEAGSA